MCRNLLLLFFALCVTGVHAQYKVRGTLRDIGSESPISSATLFIADTQIGTLSDEEGNFSFDNIPIQSGQVVVSHLLYKKKVVRLTFNEALKEDPLIVHLSPRDIETQTVTIEARKDPRRKKQLHRFEKAFLGETKNASKSVIINPEVIHFEETGNTFKAWAHDLIQVKNNALGYELRFSLSAFSIQGAEVSYAGKPYFVPLVPANEREQKQWEKRRKKSYHGSMGHFFHSLMQGNVRQAGFEVTHAKMTTAGLIAGKKLNPKNLIRPDGEGKPTLVLPEFIQITYKKETVESAFLGFDAGLAQAKLGRPSEREMIQQGAHETRGGVTHQTSYVFARKNAIKINHAGHILEPEALKEYGYWAWERVAEMLPIEYAMSRQPTYAPKQSIPQRNGFVLEKLRIPLEEIRQGGPPKDGIPSIDSPKFLAAQKADFIQDADEILGVYYNGIAKAYPIQILNWHEIVNDQFDGQAVVVSFCPLCGSGMAFLAETPDGKRTFGVSGLLFNSDVLLYDRETESLWSQIRSEAIAGPDAGGKLTYIATSYSTWGEWKHNYPSSKILSPQTGFRREYNRTPYAGYEESPSLMFPVAHTSKLFPNKEKVLGISINGHHKAYPFSHLERQKQSPIKDAFQGNPLQIYYNKDSHTAYITDEAGNPFPSVRLFWFAWYAFYPNTEVYKGR